METTLEELLEKFVRDRKQEIRTEIKKYGEFSEVFKAEELQRDYEDWIYELVDNFITEIDWDDVEKELKDQVSMLSP